MLKMVNTLYSRMLRIMFRLMRMRVVAAQTKMKNLLFKKIKSQTKCHRMKLKISGQIPLLTWVICRSISIGTIMLGFLTSFPMLPLTTLKTLVESSTTILMQHKANLFLNGRLIRRMKMRLLQRPRVPTPTSSKVWIDS